MFFLGKNDKILGFLFCHYLALDKLIPFYSLCRENPASILYNKESPYVVWYFAELLELFEWRIEATACKSTLLICLIIVYAFNFY